MQCKNVLAFSKSYDWLLCSNLPWKAFHSHRLNGQDADPRVRSRKSKRRRPLFFSFQICRFCWNKIRTEGSGLCPACRSPYAENPADFKPLTAEELAKIKEEKRKKDQVRRSKWSQHRNLSTRTRMFKLFLQTFWAKKTL
jgi:hypothetical protein